MLVRPVLEYACVAWSPYHQCNVHAIEMVQSHAARYVLNKFDRYTSVSDMISLLGWPTLESRRNTLRMFMMYKIMNNVADVPTNTILLPSTLQLRGHYDNYLAESILIPFFLKRLNYGTVYLST